MSWLTVVFLGLVLIVCGGAVVLARWSRRQRWFTERRALTLLLVVIALSLVWWPIAALLS